MRQVSSRSSPGITTIEVDGSLDAVSAYDLHLALDAAVRRRGRRVRLDLSRVTRLDDDGVRGLIRCCETAIGAGVRLTMGGCSRPSLAALRDFQIRRAR